MLPLKRNRPFLFVLFEMRRKNKAGLAAELTSSRLIDARTRHYAKVWSDAVRWCEADLRIALAAGARFEA